MGMTSPLPTDRLKAAVERRSYYSPSDGQVLSVKLKAAHNDAADFAARLLELEPWADKAREVFEELEWQEHDSTIGDSPTAWFCSYCNKEKSRGHAPDCKLKELLNDIF